MNKKIFPSLVLLIFFNTTLSSQKTYTKDIAKIIYNHCSNCHRKGEIGPFPLTNYNEVKAHGQTIKNVTHSKYMPPWKADPSFQTYREENYLIDEQIATIANWVDNGMPYGVATEEPKLPSFPEGSTLGKPDLVLNFKKTYKHKGSDGDQYWYFVLPTGLTENKIIKAIELRPGNKKIVHHALFFQDTTGRAKKIDDATPEYGFSADNNQFDINAVLNYVQYPGYVPGQKPIRFPETIGQRMNKNSDLVIQMHYAPTVTDEIDSSTVNIFFADPNEKIQRFVTDKIMLPLDLPGGFFSFFIPGGQKKKFIGKWKTPNDISILSVFPHMHLLGRSWNVWIEKPNGTKENLIKITDWDFNWQGGYYYKKFIVAPKNSTIVAEAEYDNTADNPRNPNNPPQLVFWGENTKDEMYYFPILSVLYRAGDESIVFDKATSTKEVTPSTKNQIEIYPNPTSNELINIKIELVEASKLNITIMNVQGKIIRKLREGEFYMVGTHIIQLDPSTFSNGTYYAVIEDDKNITVEQILITK
jgi:hypothetical protein